jgi:transcriptional regulator with XRE-family HTH domain
MTRRTNNDACGIGRFILELCESNNEVQSDLAAKLGVTRSFVSKVIYGDKTVPADWYYKINKAYDLTDKQKEKLDELIFFSRNRKLLDLTMFDDNEVYSILRYVYDRYVFMKEVK